MIWYLDTSAFLKVVVAEAESPALRRWFARQDEVWSSSLLQTEALRAGARLGLASDVVEEALETITLVLPTASTFYVAGQLGPSTLRSLDALHLATALELGSDLAGVVTYDERLVEAASLASVAVLAPR